MRPFFVLKNQKELTTDIQSCYNYICSIQKSMHPDDALKTAVFKNGSKEREPLEWIFNKYNFLMGYVLVWELPAGNSIRAHRDGPLTLEQGNPRKIALNVPVSGCNESCVTSFYDVDEKYVYVDQEARSRFIKTGSPVKKIDEYRLLDEPIVLDTQIFHDLDNTKNFEKRISISWTTTFDNLKECLEYFSK